MKVSKFNINETSVELIGSDIKTNTGSDKPASIKSIEETYGTYSQDNEYIHMITDNQDRIISGINKNGEIIYSKIPPQISETIQTSINEKIEVLESSIDSSIQEMNEYIDNSIKDMSDTLDSFEKTDNSEYVYCITDESDKLLFGIDVSGNVNWSKGIPNHIQEKIDALKDNIKSLDSVDIFSLVDNENRIVETITSTGTRKHYITNKFIKPIELSNEALTQLEKDLKANGLSVLNFADWSEANDLKIEIPRCARMNIIGTDEMPTTKTQNMKVIIQFYDMQGNYFKKNAIINAQGRSSMAHPKKNISIDICNDEWIGDDTFKIQFGNWVPQDSFHIKAYYNDPFRGMGVVSYKLYDEVLKSRGLLNDYVWKRAQLSLSDITSTSNGCTDASDTQKQYTSGARCFPDGFPIIIYLNSEFYGIFSWQLKKHRDNYNMKKNNPKHIHLDGIVSASTLFNANGDASKINWVPNGSPEGFEIRNPKKLYLMDGTEYDADNNSGEIMDATSEYYDENNEDHVNTAQVKEYILNASKMLTIIENAYTVFNNSQKTPEDIQTFKSVFETYFDAQNLMDYLITSDLIKNYDGFGQNWQWVTYDGIKWYVCIYDCDGTFGNWWQCNDNILPPNTSHQCTTIMFKYLLCDIYTDEIRNRYKELRDLKIFEHRHIMNMIQDWLDRIGNKETFEKEWEKWSAFIKNDSILRVDKWLTESINNMDNLYNYEK